MTSAVLPRKASVVIVGGGIAGCSVAYHLSKLGYRDILLLERKRLASGTTWHAAGLLAQLRSNRTQTKLAKYSLDLYEQLEKETGQATGFKRNGTILLAKSNARWIELKRRFSASKFFGLDCELVDTDTIKNIWDLLVIDDLKGGLYVPSDGQIDPTGVTLALAKGARNSGALIIENIRVNGFELNNNLISAVETDKGTVACEIVINCGGMWAREVGRMAGANIPVQAVEHMYIVTEPITGLHPELPSLRDYDGLTYFKVDAGKLVMGGTEKVARPWPVTRIPSDFEFTLLNEDWGQFEELVTSATKRIPALENAGVRQFINGPESFTPDGEYLLGTSLEVENFFVCAGFNSTGICVSGGAGMALAQWIVEGAPTVDISSVNVRRFHTFQSTDHYLQSRVREIASRAFCMHWPHLQPETARGIRRSAIHLELAKKNACFGEAAGWERPNWFAPKGVEPKYHYSYGRQNWFYYSAEEHKAVRERVGLIDMSSFSKFKIEGKNAINLLQLLCTKNIDVPINSLLYTLMLNPRGGIECDITIARTGTREFVIYCGAGAFNHVFCWIRSHIKPKWTVSINDVTSGEGVIAVMGPKSRKLISKLTHANLSNEAFPFMTCQNIEVSHTVCRASRISFVGELGWELNIPTEFMGIVYEQLLEAGKEFNIQDVGYHALDSLRMERGYRHYGHDISAWDTPLEAGLNFAVDLNKNDDYIGRTTIQKQLGRLTRQMVIFSLEDPDLLFYNQEPVFRDGEMVGEITSTSYGHTVGCAVGLGYIHNEGGITNDFIENGNFEIEIEAKRAKSKASLLAPYDPYKKRVKM